jgi:hypothetical protein
MVCDRSLLISFRPPAPAETGHPLPGITGQPQSAIHLVDDVLRPNLSLYSTLIPGFMSRALILYLGRWGRRFPYVVLILTEQNRGIKGTNTGIGQHGQITQNMPLRLLVVLVISFRPSSVTGITNCLRSLLLLLSSQASWMDMQNKIAPMEKVPRIPKGTIDLPQPVTHVNSVAGSEAAAPSQSVPLPSVVTLKPATCGHFKTGHFARPRT